jgi:hypothetical protein
MASSYTTGFSLEKIGSGEQSGTWGDTSNFNWDIVDRLASYKAVAITTNADAHTLTVREASPDSGTENLQDGMYRVIKFTGALDSTCIVTIAPNTAPAYFIMENATTGSQALTIKQGTGGTVALQNGKNVMVYCDGAGSGAAVVDALADLQIGTLEVTGAAAIDGDATFGNDIKLLSDSSVLSFGADGDVTVTHDPDDGLFLKSTATPDGNPFLLTLQTGETDIALNDIIGRINFQAPDEAAGTDAILVSARISAVSEGDYSSSNNATKLSFATGASEAAQEKMSLSSAGLLTVSGRIITDDTTAATSTTDGSLQTDGGLSVAADAVIGDDLLLLSDAAVLSFGANSEVTLTHVHNDGLLLNTDMQLQFRDSAINIRSDADGDLDINADDEIELNSTLIDINGNVDISGTGAITGHASIGVNAVDASRALTVAGASDGTGSSIFVGYNSSLASKFSVRDDGYTVIGGGATVTGNGDVSGKLAVGAAFTPSYTFDIRGTDAQIMRCADATPTEYFGLFNANTGATTPNAAAATCKVRGMTSTSRSINAGGTVNASGADYAEYMTKADECNTIEKGTVCGVNSDGKLTDVFTDAHSFVIKSTDPSYVGGDTWGIKSTDSDGTEVMLEGDHYEKDDDGNDIFVECEELEEARQKVDRIAFSGQVPCLITGDAAVGDYAIPQAKDDGSIEAVAVSDPTFEQYRAAVGRVWKLNSETKKHIVSVKVS